MNQRVVRFIAWLLAGLIPIVRGQPFGFPSTINIKPYYWLGVNYTNLTSRDRVLAGRVLLLSAMPVTAQAVIPVV